MSFGKSIHATLQLFHQQEMQGHSPTLKTLLTLYRDNFIEDGYESAAFKAERYQAGVKALTHYFHTYRQVLGQPVMLEQQFQLKLDQVTLIGKIDRLEKESDGSYALVDYKTGEPQNQKAVDKDEQLTLYALAAQEALGINVNHLSLYFLEGDVGKVTTTRTPAQLQKAKEKLEKTIALVKQSAFPPKPSEFTCKYCEFNQLCPFAVR